MFKTARHDYKLFDKAKVGSNSIMLNVEDIQKIPKYQ